MDAQRLDVDRVQAVYEEQTHTKTEKTVDLNHSNIVAHSLYDSCFDLLRIVVHLRLQKVRTLFACLRVQHGVHREANLVDPLQVVSADLDVKIETHVVLFENGSILRWMLAQSAQHGRVSGAGAILLEFHVRTKYDGH